MPETKSPSQEEPKQGVFDSIRGAKSQDPDEVETPAEETKTAEPEKPAEKAKPREPGEPESKEADDARVGKQAQRIAQLERQINQLGPWAQFGMAVGGDPKGKKLVDRYEKGQKLFVGEEEFNMPPESETTEAEKPMTREEFANLLDQREATQNLTSELNEIAEENLPQFNKIRRNPRYAELFGIYQQSLWNPRGNMQLDEDVIDWNNEFAAKQYTAMKKAYNTYLAENPKVLEATKKAGKREAEDRAAELSAVPSSTGEQTTSSQEETGEPTETEEMVDRMLKARGRGKSFASIGSKR